MAIAFLSPPDRAAADRRRSQSERLQSVDPTERWKAREEILTDAASELGRSLAQQANRNAEALRRQEREIERYERQHAKYKPLPPGAKIIKK